jgi:hypothetical protein
MSVFANAYALARACVWFDHFFFYMAFLRQSASIVVRARRRGRGRGPRAAEPWESVCLPVGAPPSYGTMARCLAFHLVRSIVMGMSSRGLLSPGNLVGGFEPAQERQASLVPLMQQASGVLCALQIALCLLVLSVNTNVWRPKGGTWHRQGTMLTR